MRRIDVISTDIASVGYDHEEGTLQIEFIDLCVYDFFDVPSDIYAAFMGADSHGDYFRNFIQDRYESDRIL